MTKKIIIFLLIGAILAITNKNHASAGLLFYDLI